MWDLPLTCDLGDRHGRAGERAIPPNAAPGTSVSDSVIGLIELPCPFGDHLLTMLPLRSNLVRIISPLFDVPAQ
jgi:hypothetical protein